MTSSWILLPVKKNVLIKFTTILLSLSTEKRRYTKPVGTRPGIMYGSCKIHKDLFKFATEMVEQDSSNFMGILDVNSLFTNVPLEETIEICTNNLFKHKYIVHDLTKIEFQDLLFVATKESHFIFINILYRQIDGVAMGSPLGPSLANAFWLTMSKFG